MIITQTLVWDIGSDDFPEIQRILDEEIEINWNMNKLQMIDNTISFIPGE